MKYYLINPVFTKDEILITNNQAIYDIETEIKKNKTKAGGYLLIKVNKMIFKLIIKEINHELCKLELTSNIYI